MVGEQMSDLCEGGEEGGARHQEHVVNITGDESGAEVEELEFLKVKNHDCLVRTESITTRHSWSPCT